ncbi:thioredoxin reductase [Patescibacteria group bacterium]|nr:thioredoxin reductase [Patescibacteria group bacterium]
MADTKKESPNVYDVAVIGAGPAGLSASVYLSRYKLSNLVLGPEYGGYVSTTHLVEDYLGFLTVSGLELADHFTKHAQNYQDAEVVADKVTEMKQNGKLFDLKTWNGKEYQARSVLIATGTVHNKLDVPGEKEFEGHGVSYCVTCDAAFFKNRRVAIVGGGDSGAKGALHLADFASEVYWIHRRDTFRAEPIWVDRVKEKPNVQFVMENTITEIVGKDNKLTGVKLAKPFEGKSNIALDGVFVEIGSHPDKTLPGMVGATTDGDGNLIVNNHQRTSAEFVWGAGDNTTASALFRQISTAVSEGSIAAGDIYEYLNDPRADWHSKGPIVTD